MLGEMEAAKSQSGSSSHRPPPHSLLEVPIWLSLPKLQLLLTYSSPSSCRKQRPYNLTPQPRAEEVCQWSRPSGALRDD